MAQANIGLVYGGGSLGLMGEIARAVLWHDGHVTGIIPEFLSTREKMHKDVQELIVTHSMHERKQIMFDKSDAFVALPGGVGTLEELVEQLAYFIRVARVFALERLGRRLPARDAIPHASGQGLLFAGVRRNDM